MYTQETKRANATDMCDVDHPSISTREIDDAELARMGKRPVLKVCRNSGSVDFQIGFSIY